MGLALSTVVLLVKCAASTSTGSLQMRKWRPWHSKDFDEGEKLEEAEEEQRGGEREREREREVVEGKKKDESMYVSWERLI